MKNRAVIFLNYDTISTYQALWFIDLYGLFSLGCTDFRDVKHLKIPLLLKSLKGLSTGFNGKLSCHMVDESLFYT